MNNKHSFTVFIFLSFLAHVIFLSDLVLARWILKPNMPYSKNIVLKAKREKEKEENISIVFGQGDSKTESTRNFPSVLQGSRGIYVSQKKINERQLEGYKSKMLMKASPSADTETKIQNKTSEAHENNKTKNIPLFAVNTKTAAMDVPVQSDSVNLSGEKELTSSGTDTNSKGDGEGNGNDDGYSGNTGGSSKVSVPAGNFSANGNGAGTKTDFPASGNSLKELAAISSYLNKVRGKILKEKVFPPKLSQKGYGGTVLLKITLAADGALKHVHVESSSGFSELDNYAKTFIEQLSPFFPFPEQIKRASLVFRIPLRFIITSR